MLDEKGRLFGKINIIDLLVVLLVLVVAAVVAIKLLGGGDGLPGAEGTSTHLTYTVEVDGVKPEVYENLKGYVEQEGGDQLMASGDMLNAYVTGVTAAPHDEGVSVNTAVMATGGSVLVRNVIPKHLECITAKLEEMGAQVEELDDAVRVTRLEPLNKINLKTLPYPGFPTDMQPQLVAALCLAQGTSVITEGVWDNRYRYVEELRRMGARIQVDGKVAIVEGVPELTGAKVQACDLRAGAAMVIAGLAAHGTTEVDGIAYIERGYENIVEKLQGLGADITRVTVPEEDRMPMAR